MICTLVFLDKQGYRSMLPLCSPPALPLQSSCSISAPKAPPGAPRGYCGGFSCDGGIGTVLEIAPPPRGEGPRRGTESDPPARRPFVLRPLNYVWSFPHATASNLCVTAISLFSPHSPLLSFCSPAALPLLCPCSTPALPLLFGSSCPCYEALETYGYFPTCFEALLLPPARMLSHALKLLTCTACCHML